ncbi:MAG: aromatic amino acid transport family protein [Cyanobacteria bacterium J06573_11]
MTSLFSHIAPSEDLPNSRLVHQPGSVIGSSALIAGTTVGAGILALPAVTFPAGVIPSTVLMVAVWLYMVISGLLIAEVNLQAMRQSGQPTIGLLATIRGSLGNGGAIASGILYLFIHYALLIAYVARGGDLLAEGLQSLANTQGLTFSVPLWAGHVVFSVVFGGLLYFGRDRTISKINTILVAIVVVTFVGLLSLTLRQTHPAQLAYQNWHALSTAIPVIVVAFVYHNVVPVVTTQLEGDGTKVRQAILIGAAVPLVMFIAWNAVILTSVDVGVEALNLAIIDPIELLRKGDGFPGLGTLVSVFSEGAIATSFIGFVFGLLNFFQDLFSQLPSSFPAESDTSNLEETESPIFSLGASKKSLLYGLVFLPPLALSVVSPTIFFSAIDFAGAFGNSILFGVIPAVMAWQWRSQFPSMARPLVPGGKITLTVMIGCAIAVICQNILIKSQLI